jgi:predicted nucleic acid-binding Zn ribbon protein
VRRPGPRPLAAALAEVTRERAPATLLASVQSAWAEVAGPVVAEESQPVSECDGTLTVECRSAVWAQELELLAPELLERLARRLGGPGRVRRMRFVTKSDRSS